MKKRTAFIGAILCLIPIGQPLLIKTGVVLSGSAVIFSLPEKAKAENAEYYFDVGYEMFKKGEFYSAISNFKKAIKINPNYADAYTSMCGAKINIGMKNQALLDCEKALSIFKKFKLKKSKKVLYANFCGAIEDKYEAISFCNKSIRLDSQYDLPFYNRSVLKEQIGDMKGACLDAKKAVSLGYLDKENKRWINENC